METKKFFLCENNTLCESQCEKCRQKQLIEEQKKHRLTFMNPVISRNNGKRFDLSSYQSQHYEDYFIIVKAMDLPSLVESVNKMYDKGYKCTGSVLVALNEKIQHEQFVTMFYQPMELKNTIQL